ncbi:MAG: hypothetical protein F6K41_12325 [Symploca sp. SIO3E6]|nr:hypothetical protein [Caldora sp. SIO3E6]
MSEKRDAGTRGRGDAEKGNPTENFVHLQKTYIWKYPRVKENCILLPPLLRSSAPLTTAFLP